MPDDIISDDTQGTGGDSDQTISMAEHKKLQRTLARRDAKVKTLEQSIAENRSTGERQEELLANVIHMFTLDDDARTQRAAELLPNMEARREYDMSSAQVKAELSRLTDGADVDLDTDERLREARNLIEEMARTGNPALGQEALRRAQEALEEKGGDASTADIESVVRAAILKDRQEHGRVDTGQSTAHVAGNVTRQDLASLNPKSGLAAMRETTEKALEQLGL